MAPNRTEASTDATMPWITKKLAFVGEKGGWERRHKGHATGCAPRPARRRVRCLQGSGKKRCGAGIVCDWHLLRAARAPARCRQVPASGRRRGLRRSAAGCARPRCTTLWTSARTSPPGRARIGFGGVATKTGSGATCQPRRRPAAGWPQGKAPFAPETIAAGAVCTSARSHFCLETPAPTAAPAAGRLPHRQAGPA